MAGANALSVGCCWGWSDWPAGGLLTTPVLVGVSVLYGIMDTVRMSATQAYGRPATVLLTYDWVADIRTVSRMPYRMLTQTSTAWSAGQPAAARLSPGAARR